VDKTLPRLVKRVKKEGGVLIYEDEASFKVSGTVSRGWMKKGRNEGKEVKSAPGRESVKAFGAVTVSDAPKFHFLFATVFNAQTFLKFLKQLVRQYSSKKIRLVLDNASYHHAEIVSEWLKLNKKRIVLHFLPAYSPDYNAQEGVWRLTRRKSTHNRHFKNEKDLHAALFKRFNRFQGNPASLRGMIAPFYRKMAK
jgi:transposase